MSPVHKSVSANPLRRIWNGVLTNVCFQITTKINAFPATATGDKTAIAIEVDKATSQLEEKKSFSLLSPIVPQPVQNVFSGEGVLLNMIYLCS